MLYGLILAGGRGKRLWPESDANTPKQFLSRTGGKSLLFETVSRLRSFIPSERIFVSTTSKFAFRTKEILNDDRITVISEPVGRNTAPAIALAALKILQSDPDAVMAVLPSDHFIDNVDAFRLVLESAAALLEEDPTRLVTIGIIPHSPATEYGYIQAPAPLLSGKSITMIAESLPRRVDLFVEKPERATAEKFINQGGFYWNSGIFIWKAARILDLIGRFLPELAPFVVKNVRYLASASCDLCNAYNSLPSISIDKAVMEKARNIILLPASFRWSDLGTFETFSLFDNSNVGFEDNSVLGASLFSAEASGNIVRVTLPDGAEPFTVALGGVDHLLIVLKGNTLLVVPQGREDLIQRLADQKDSS